jgi:peroxiredoxin
LALVAASFFLFVACSGLTGAAARTDESAPDFQLELFANENHAEGEQITLAQFAGKPVVINFWFPSCPPCRLEMPDLEASSRKHRADGVQFIGVQQLGLDSIEEGQEFIDEFGITYAVGPDATGRIVIDYNVTGFPTTVFLDEQHIVVQTWAGALTADKLEELIQPLIQ